MIYIKLEIFLCNKCVYSNEGQRKRWLIKWLAGTGVCIQRKEFKSQDVTIIMDMACWRHRWYIFTPFSFLVLAWLILSPRTDSFYLMRPLRHTSVTESALCYDSHQVGITETMKTPAVKLARGVTRLVSLSFENVTKRLWNWPFGISALSNESLNAAATGR